MPTPATGPSNLWAIAQQRLDEAAERLRLDDGMRRVLRVPKRELTVSFPVTVIRPVGVGLPTMDRCGCSPATASTTTSIGVR